MVHDPIDFAVRAAYGHIRLTSKDTIGVELLPWENVGTDMKSEWTRVIATAIAAYLMARAEQVAAMPEHGNRTWFALQLAKDATKILNSPDEALNEGDQP